MKPRFQADADLNLTIVHAVLRSEPTVDFQTALVAGLASLKDPDVLALAARDGRILVSHDFRTMPRHFGEFIAAATSPDLLLVSQHLPIAEAAEQILLVWGATTAEEWIDRLVVLPL